ncbi:hypothetical protein CASFOL_041169 [Castilleja foliolosa]|uniref:Protein farnesyltransferase/geranylgeranyltransferase type-1 subunit alpha n=1 Tax=Castilleja foliolosa TaxID=1961234 RepID=A0ABD3BDN8_9LAMI
MQRQTMSSNSLLKSYPITLTTITPGLTDRWVREFFGKDWGKAELDYCKKILKEDASNCFEWNQRYFVLQKHLKWHKTRGNEVKYAIAAIHAEPENEMPWMYLKCLVSGTNYQVLNDSSTFVLSNVVRHIKEGKVDLRDDAYVKKRVVNALMMVLFALKQSNFKPNHELKTNIDYLCLPEAAEESFAEKVVSIYWRFMNKRINTGTKSENSLVNLGTKINKGEERKDVIKKRKCISKEESPNLLTTKYGSNSHKRAWSSSSVQQKKTK